MQKPNLFIATPCYDGNVTSGYVMSLMALQRILIQNGIGHDVCLHSDSLITRARNNMTERFLRDSAYTHLLFIDADIAFDPATVLRFLDFDEEVVAGIYPIKELNIGELRRLPIDDDRTAEAASYNYSSQIVLDDANMPRNGFVQVEHAATGFMMIRRGALEMLIERYPELRYSEDFTANRAETSYALFDTMIHEGQYLPEDYSFCKRWRDIGGIIWADVVSRFDHIGRFVYSGHAAARVLQMTMTKGN